MGPGGKFSDFSPPFFSALVLRGWMPEGCRGVLWILPKTSSETEIQATICISLKNASLSRGSGYIQGRLTGMSEVRPGKYV